MIKILFLHGWGSVPGGVKPTYLQEHGCDVINPKLDDYDFELAIETAQAEFDRNLPDVIVGSSRGGAVAMNIEVGATPLVLLCPAWKKWGTARMVHPRTIILHSRQDEIVPYEDSVDLARASEASLMEVGYDHRLADNKTLEVMLWACRIAKAGEQVPMLDDDLPSQIQQSKRGKGLLRDEGRYICDACGEEIVVPLDLTQGTSQKYVEDCPVCCRSNVIFVVVDVDGNTSVHAEPEQDHD